jgi:hypothetical protein
MSVEKKLSGEYVTSRVMALMPGSVRGMLSSEEQANLAAAAEEVPENHRNLQVVADYATFLQEHGGRYRRIGFLVTLLADLIRSINDQDQDVTLAFLTATLRVQELAG